MSNLTRAMELMESAKIEISTMPSFDASNHTLVSLVLAINTVISRIKDIERGDSNAGN